MIKHHALPRRIGVVMISLFLVFLIGRADAAAQTAIATEALIHRVAALTEHGDPAAMEKMTAGYLIDASKKFNPGISDETWGSVRADVNEIVSNKIKPGYGEQALLTRHFVESAKFSDDELRHLITILQDPVMQRWAVAMRGAGTSAYMATLSQQVNNQMWMVVSIVLRRHGLQTADTSTTAKQSR
ncbi:hypothetical protein [Paraburkholderia caribensis]|uniref:hypothetical protein n=1 Tax=Paraburkholderia caribensis TaxID=75105 RepID=UPI001D094D0F|nr:hypothetical protein [Paraburkholderia caribensis]